MLQIKSRAHRGRFLIGCCPLPVNVNGLIHFCPIWRLETDALDQRLSICPTFGGKEDHDVPLYQGFLTKS